MTQHRHIGFCGTEFPCIINILPLPGGLGRIRCERWPDSICPTCFEGCLEAAKDETERQAILKSMSEVPDALLAYRAKQKLVGMA
jgi:hypothetical protein